MGNSYEEFAARLRASIPGVLAIAEWFYRKGWAVSLPALVLRPKDAPYQDYQDRGDLFVTKGDKALRLEVKYLQRGNFTCREDYPFPDFFIADKNAVDRAKGEVAGYFWVSNDREHAAFVRQETSEHWRATVRFMKNTDREQAMYVCPLEHVEFVKIKGE
jgi:hypothetical protein